jgi:hypothetical protein
MKRVSNICLSFACILAIGGGATAQDAPNLLKKGQSYSVINAQNFGEADYRPPAPSPEATQIRMKLKGYVFGLRIMRSDYIAWFDDRDYAAYTDVRTSGLAALLKKMNIWAVASGSWTRAGLKPEFHVQQNTDKKNRRVEMVYDNIAQNVDVAIVPPLGSQGMPPASPEERYRAHDTISAILTMALTGTQLDGELCSGRVPIFDSKQHYNLRMERVGTRRVKFDGQKAETIHCHAYYEPVSGFDAEDLPDAEEAGTPINVYFRHYPEANLHLPVRFTYKISSITAVIKADDIEMILPTTR